MTDIKQYLLSVMAVVLLTSLCDSLIQDGRIKKTASFISTVLLTVSILSPVLKIEEKDVKGAFRTIQEQSGLQSTEYAAVLERGLDQLISERCASYIVGEAAAMGVTVEAAITTSKNGSVPYPESVVVSGNYTNVEQDILARIILEDLGISLDKQEWIGY